MRSDEEVSFWLAVNARPLDPLPRLILADWLDEHNRGYEAEALRWLVDQELWPHMSRNFTGFTIPCRRARNIDAALRFLKWWDSNWSQTATVVAALQGFCVGWSLCRRADVAPLGEYDENRKSRWRVIAGVTISFALAQMPDDKRWDEKEQRKAVNAAYPFGERRFHPYKVWLSEVKRRLGPMYRGRRVRTEQRGLFEVANG